MLHCFFQTFFLKHTNVFYLLQHCVSMNVPISLHVRVTYVFSVLNSFPLSCLGFFLFLKIITLQYALVLSDGVCSLLQCCLPDLWHSDSTLYTSAWQSYPVVRNLRIPSVFSWRNFESQANTFILTFLQGCPIFTSCQHMFVWSHSSLPSVTPLPFPSVPLSGIRRELRM